LRYRFTRFTVAHLPGLLELERLVFPRDAYPREFFLDLHADCGEWFLVAFDGERPAGYIVGCTTKRGNFEIASIAVHPDDRRKGLGGEMLKRMLRAAEKLEVKQVELMVRPENQAAIDFYRKFGFKRIGRILRYYEDGTDAIRMVLSAGKRRRLSVRR
jgi:[ribosomal protein S18]-alanine N-acetyltransferase